MKLAAAVLASLLAGCAATPHHPVPAAATRAGRDAIAMQQVRALGRDGDWLVIRGYNLTDDLVATITNKPFSHVAVLDLSHDRIVEAESQGVHFTPLATFVGKSHRVLLVRPMWSTATTAVTAVERARSVVGRPYDFLGLIGMNIPESFYCSELAVEVYRPSIRKQDLVPRPVEPGQLHYWGTILFDSGAAWE